MEIVCNTNNIKLIKEVLKLEEQHVEKISSFNIPKEIENPMCFLCMKELDNKKRELFTVIKDYQLLKTVCLECYKEIVKNATIKS